MLINRIEILQMVEIRWSSHFEIRISCYLSCATSDILTARSQRCLNASQTSFTIRLEIHLVANAKRIVRQIVKIGLSELTWAWALDEVGWGVLVKVISQLHQICQLFFLKLVLELQPWEFLSFSDYQRTFSSGIVIELQTRTICESSTSLVLGDGIKHNRTIFSLNFNAILQPLKLCNRLHLNLNFCKVIQILVISQPKSSLTRHIWADVRLFLNWCDFRGINFPEVGSGTAFCFQMPDLSFLIPYGRFYLWQQNQVSWMQYLDWSRNQHLFLLLQLVWIRLVYLFWSRNRFYCCQSRSVKCLDSPTQVLMLLHLDNHLRTNSILVQQIYMFGVKSIA